jgi:hypothetical protein
VSAHTWDIECVAFFPVANDDRRRGYAHLKLPGGMLLKDVGIIQTSYGSRATFPRARNQGDPGDFKKLHAAIFFPDEANWIAFSAAAVKAVRAAYPSALPPGRETTAIALSTSLAATAA